MKLRRPRFSVRTLAILVTLVCAYFGAWEVTRASVNNEFDGIQFANSPMPLLFWRVEIVREVWGDPGEWRRCYYLWLFGPTIKLPFECEWK